MGENTVFSVGYPLGFSLLDGAEYYNVQLNGEVYPIGLLSAYVWMEALNGGQTVMGVIENVLLELQNKGYELDKHFTVKDIEAVYQLLVNRSLIVEIDEDDVDGFIDMCTNLRCVRTGFGLGINGDVIEIHNDAKSIMVGNMEYYIWQQGTEAKTLKQSYDEYINAVHDSVLQIGGNPDESKYEFTKIFIDGFTNLYRKSLIYIVSI